MLGKTEGRRTMRRFDDITNSMNMSLSKLQEIVKDREAWHSAVHGVPKSWTRLSDLTLVLCSFIVFVSFIWSCTQGNINWVFCTRPPGLQRGIRHCPHLPEVQMDQENKSMCHEMWLEGHLSQPGLSKDQGTLPGGGMSTTNWHLPSTYLTLLSHFSRVQLCVTP